jgi:hypothetical protein
MAAVYLAVSGFFSLFYYRFNDECGLGLPDRTAAFYFAFQIMLTLNFGVCLV